VLRLFYIPVEMVVPEFLEWKGNGHLYVWDNGAGPASPPNKLPERAIPGHLIPSDSLTELERTDSAEASNPTKGAFGQPSIVKLDDDATARTVCIATEGSEVFILFYGCPKSSAARRPERDVAPEVRLQAPLEVRLHIG